MITPEGAGLLATIVPIALVLLTFQVRDIRRFYAATRGALLLRRATQWALVVSVCAGTACMGALIGAVNSHVAIRGFNAWLTWAEVQLIGDVAIVVLAMSALDASGLAADINRRWRSKHPELAAERDEFVRRNYPDD